MYNLTKAAKDVATHYFNLDGFKLCNDYLQKKKDNSENPEEKETLVNKITNQMFKGLYNSLRFGGIAIDLAILDSFVKTYDSIGFTAQGAIFSGTAVLMNHLFQYETRQELVKLTNLEKDKSKTKLLLKNYCTTVDKTINTIDNLSKILDES